MTISPSENDPRSNYTVETDDPAQQFNNYECQDCYKNFEQTEAVNASLDPTEYNPACPFCGGDNLEERK